MQNSECGVSRPIRGLGQPCKRSALHIRRCGRATALIETAIVLPLYMILLFGLLYFGYATLGRQRQDKATAYEAWQSVTQQDPGLLTTFWGTSQPADTTFSVYGGGANGQSEWVRQSDEYYGMEKYVSPQSGVQWLLPGAANYNPAWNFSDNIDGSTVVFIPYQLQSGYHTLSSGGGDLFDSERVTVDLWTFALGTVTQSFNWTPGAGVQQQFITNYTSFANYLNMASPANLKLQGGVLMADASDPPTNAEASAPGPGGLLANALNGPPGGAQWLQRRSVESTMSYNPPFLSAFWGDQNAPPTTDFSKYATLNYPAPANPLTTATTDCDVTIRNAASVRQGAEEGAQLPAQFLSGIGAIIGEGGTLPPPPLDTLVLDTYGDTIATLWIPK
jgi:hypothetical protein